MWLLVDGNSWFHSDWHGAKENAPSTFDRRLFDLNEKYKFSRTVVAFDSPPSWRNDVFASYKSNRDEKPEEFNELFETLKQSIRDDREWECIEQDRMEGDDIVASLAADAVAEGEKALICSGDKDLHQCIVGGMVSQAIKINRNFGVLECKFVTAKSMHAKYKVWPTQWVDYRAIVGDVSDCIPGCMGLGEEAATKVLSVYQSLDEFAEDPTKVKLGPKTRERLIEFCKEELSLYRRIIRLGDLSGTVLCQGNSTSSWQDK